MNNLIEQIVEVLTKHSKQSFEAGEGSVIYQQSFQSAATEIAALHPLTKIREEVERLRYEAAANISESTEEGDMDSISRQGAALAAYDRVLSLLTQENGRRATVANKLTEAKVTTCPDCLDGRDEFEPDWQCPDCRNSIPPFTP